MSCSFSESEFRPIISSGLILHKLIQDPVMNASFYANRINDELHSIIEMILMPFDKEFRTQALQNRIQTLKELIKASSHPSSPNILQHIEKIHGIAEVYLTSSKKTENNRSKLVLEEAQIKQSLMKIAQDDANKLIEKLWAMVSTLNRSKKHEENVVSTLSQHYTHEENRNQFDKHMKELISEINHQAYRIKPWEWVEQVYSLKNCVQLITSEHEKNGCSQNKRKKCGNDSKHSNTIFPPNKRPQITVQLPECLVSSSSSSSMHRVFSVPITPPAQISPKTLSFPIHPITAPQPSPSTPVGETCLSLGRLQMKSPKTPTPAPSTHKMMIKSLSDRSLIESEEISTRQDSSFTSSMSKSAYDVDLRQLKVVLPKSTIPNQSQASPITPVREACSALSQFHFASPLPVSRSPREILKIASEVSRMQHISVAPPVSKSTPMPKSKSDAPLDRLESPSTSVSQTSLSPRQVQVVSNKTSATTTPSP
jgi:hypothetical protein